MERFISLGKRIKELRLKKNMSQVELAKEICTPSMISQIESDRARPSYKILHALCEKLEITIENILGNVELNAEFMSMYKMTRALRASKNFGAAIPLLEKLLEEPRAAVSALDLKFDLAISYFEQGNMDKSEETLREVWDFAMLRQEHEMAVNVSFYLGLIEFERKHYILAIFHLEKAEERLMRGVIKYFDPESKAKIFHMLAKSYSKIGKIEKSLETFEKAANNFQECNSIIELANVYAEMGWTFNSLKQYEKSSDYSDRSFALYEVLNQQKQMALMKMNRAVQLNEIGKHYEALSLLESAIEQLWKYDAKVEIGCAMVELSKVQLSIREFEKAEEYCKSASQLLDHQNVSFGWVNRVLASVALFRQDVDRALLLLETASDRFKQTECFTEWADTMSEIAQIHKDQNRPELAVEILKEVRFSMQKMLMSKGIVL